MSDLFDRAAGAARMTTVRDMVIAIRDEVSAGNLTPMRAGELATELAALLGNITDHIRACDVAYNRVYAHLLDSEGKANRAKVKADTSAEYLARREAHDQLLVATEMMRSLRKLQDTYREEMRMTPR